MADRMMHPDAMAYMAPTPQDIALVSFADQSADPCYLQLTTDKPPDSKTIIKQSEIPLGCVVNPVYPDEDIPEIYYGNTKIIRCVSCKGYICPFISIDMDYWTCALCEAQNPIPDIRLFSRENRKELQKGSFDIIASEDYIVQMPMAPTYVFIINTQQQSYTSGMINVIWDAITHLCDEQAFPGEPRAQVALITYDTAVHFWNLEKSEPQVYSINDSPIFLPVPPHLLLVNTEDAAPALTRACELISSRNPEGQPLTSPLGHLALRAAYALMIDTGGKILYFAPESCPTDMGNNKTVMINPNLKVYTEFAQSFSNKNICVDLFIASTMHCNLISLAELSRHTGGDINFYPNFKMQFHGRKLYEEIVHNITRHAVWEGMFRLRVSKGWKVTEQFGHFSKKQNDILAIPHLDWDKSIAWLFEPVDERSLSSHLVLQAALLYTTIDGEKRIRIHTTKLQLVNQVQDVFNYVNPFALLNIVTKICMNKIYTEERLTRAREVVDTICRNIIKYGDVPDAIEPFMLRSLGLLKHVCMATDSQGNNIWLDTCAYLRCRLMTAKSDVINLWVYPALYDMTDIGENMPLPMPLATKNVDVEGIYILSTGIELLVWIGREVPDSLIQQLFNIDTFRSLRNPTEFSIQDSEYSRRFMGIVDKIRRMGGIWQGMTIIKNGDTNEQHFFIRLVEERTNIPLTYEEYLKNLKRP